MSLETTTLGGGCFWCLEAVYDEMKGITSVESGFMGGRRPNPTYEQVCTGATGHIEVVQITFDPDVVSFREILEVFFVIHDPTSMDRQGNDAGEQYRSVIFYHSDEQRVVAAEMIKPPMVTELRPAETFWPAEEYHQEYFARNPNQGYCTFVVGPKVQKFRKTFAEYTK